MRIYDFDDYREYLQERIRQQPGEGRGERARMAAHLRIHSTLMSLILSGRREISQEQAIDLCDYLDLSEAESEYFLVLTQLSRAGTVRLREHLKKKRSALREQSLTVRSRVKAPRELGDRERAVFYSSWLYSAIRLYCSTSPKGRTVEEIAERFRQPRPQIAEKLAFLAGAGLVSESGSRYKMETQKTFLPFGSPLLFRHHMNWRLKSLQAAEQLTPEELMVTSPFSVSKRDFERLKRMLLDFVAESSEIIRDSPADEVACLNLDLFWVK